MSPCKSTGTLRGDTAPSGSQLRDEMTSTTIAERPDADVGTLSQQSPAQTGTLSEWRDMCTVLNFTLLSLSRPYPLPGFIPCVVLLLFSPL